MYGYIANAVDPRPQLVVGAVLPADDRLTVLVPWSTSIVVDVPETRQALIARHRGRYWSRLRRYERRLAEAHGAVTFAVLTDPDLIRPHLAAVRELFAERWQDEYTSLPWKEQAGFSAYAEDLLDRASAGDAALVVLEVDGRLLSFAYCLIDGDWFYFFQHAVTPATEFREFSLGKILVARLLEHLVDEGRCRYLDLMLGDAAYKREWESWRRPVFVRLEEPVSAVGAARVVARTVWLLVRLQVQFGSPRLRRTAKRTLIQVHRARTAAPLSGEPALWREAACRSLRR